MPPEKNRAAIVAAYAGMCAIWGTTWLGIKFSLHYLPPLVGVGLRFIVAGLVMYLISVTVSLSKGATMPKRAYPWKLIAVLAVCLFGLNYVLTYTAETRLGSGLTAVLFGTLPFFVFAFGHTLANERTTLRIWAGAVLAFGGVAVISLGGEVSGSPLFALAAIGAAAVSAFANVYARRHAHHDPMTTLPPSMLLAGIGVFLIGILVEPVSWTSAFAPASIGVLLYLSILGSCIPFFLNLWLLQRIAAWVVGLSSLIIPVIAVIVGILLGGEVFSWRELLGSALVIVGISLALT